MAFFARKSNKGDNNEIANNADSSATSDKKVN